MSHAVRDWDSVVVESSTIPTMISAEERRYLFWLTSSVWRGTGHVVEMGPWLGGSTACLSAGMMKNPARAARKLFVFDDFVWRPFMADRADLPIRAGDSFKSYFEENVERYSSLIVCQRASLPDHLLSEEGATLTRRDSEGVPTLVWTGREPVEILFIDGAKSWSGLRHLLVEFADSLIPDQALIVCQDYKYWGTYWVPLMMEMLREHFDLAHVVRQNTVTFRLRGRLPAERVWDIGQLDVLDVEEALSRIKEAARRLSRHGDAQGACIVELSAVRFLVQKGRKEEALGAFRRLESKWPLTTTARNLELARVWLSEELRLRLTPSLRSRVRSLWRR
jgi:hypothetical protein